MSSKTISTGGSSYTTSSTYDSYGRPYELTYPTVGSITGPKIRTEYSNGAAYKTTDYSSGSAGTVYHHTTAVNARGQSTGVTYGNGVTASFTYGDDTGWLKGNTVTKAGATIQSYVYDFDDVGNVTNRQLSYGVGSSANLTETFLYDNLHRLESRTVNSALNLSGALAMTESYGYDAMGNLTSKPGVGSYSFSYDANGNVTNDGKRSFIYTAYEKPSRIQQNNDFTDFEYGPNRELIKRIDKRGSNITTTLMLDGYEQVTLPTGVVEHKYSVGDAIITKRSGAPTADATQVYYLHKDQQGSTTAITDANGSTVQQLMYDPWGKQYVVNTSLLTYTSPATSKGYTGHEMVNDFEVIHMGGRTYNPVLGRFMQADPFIQSPGNLQSYNRYSYVLNNPMSYTDPSGYFFKKLFSAIAKVPILNAAVTAVLAFYCQVCLVAYNTLSTYAVTGSLRSALVSGITTAAMPGGGSFGRVLASAAIGGLASTMQGGKFGHGFVAAGLGAALGGASHGMSNPIGKVLVAAVVGGTISKVTGSKFANGAFSGAFAAALRADWDSVQNKGDGDAVPGPLTPGQRKEFLKLLSQGKHKLAAFKADLSDKTGSYNEIRRLYGFLDDAGFEGTRQFLIDKSSAAMASIDHYIANPDLLVSVTGVSGAYFDDGSRRLGLSFSLYHTDRLDTIIHEIGHSVGLTHPEATQSVSTIVGMSNSAVSAYPPGGYHHNLLRVNANAFEYAVMGRFQ